MCVQTKIFTKKKTKIFKNFCFILLKARLVLSKSKSLPEKGWSTLGRIFVFVIWNVFYHALGRIFSFQLLRFYRGDSFWTHFHQVHYQSFLDNYKVVTSLNSSVLSPKQGLSGRLQFWNHQLSHFSPDLGWGKSSNFESIGIWQYGHLKLFSRLSW